MVTKYWLMKTEPETYSIDNLRRDGRTCWEGVRNYQARNFMRDDMQVGDRVLFYHSNASPPGVAGLAEVCKAGYPDHYAWDPKSTYFDKRSRPEKPVWVMVDLRFIRAFDAVVSLAQLKANPELDAMLVVKRGMRLSVQPVEPKHFEEVVGMASGSR